MTLSADQVEQLSIYFGLLAKWNSRINLTALPLDPVTDDAVDRLIIEPILAARRVLPTDRLALDLGSGGGSPAIPLKIAVPGLRLVMVEAKVRKSAFLREVVRHLELDDVEVANARFEELLMRVDLHEAADVISIRAVRADRSLWSAMQAFLKPGGRILWFTSAEQSRLLKAPPPLTLESNEPLVSSTGSQLTILRKQS